jgi:hypothetical protein
LYTAGVNASPPSAQVSAVVVVVVAVMEVMVVEVEVKHWAEHSPEQSSQAQLSPVSMWVPPNKGKSLVATFHVEPRHWMLTAESAEEANENVKSPSVRKLGYGPEIRIWPRNF